LFVREGYAVSRDEYLTQTSPFRGLTKSRKEVRLV